MRLVLTAQNMVFPDKCSCIQMRRKCIRMLLVGILHNQLDQIDWSCCLGVQYSCLFSVYSFYQLLRTKYSNLQLYMWICLFLLPIVPVFCFIYLEVAVSLVHTFSILTVLLMNWLLYHWEMAFFNSWRAYTLKSAPLSFDQCYSWN